MKREKISCTVHTTLNDGNKKRSGKDQRDVHLRLSKGVLGKSKRWSVEYRDDSFSCLVVRPNRTGNILVKNGELKKCITPTKGREFSPAGVRHFVTAIEVEAGGTFVIPLEEVLFK